jgi:hypothetical protein
MTILPTIFAESANGCFACHLELRDGRLYRRHDDTPYPAHRAEISAQPDLVAAVQAAAPDATVTPTLWRAVALGERLWTEPNGREIHTVKATLKGRTATDSWLMGTSIFFWEDGTITTGYFQSMVLLSPRDEQEFHQETETCVWHLTDDATDDDRSRVIAWLESHGCDHLINPSQAAAKAATEAMWTKLECDLRAEREAAVAPQKADTTPLHCQPINPVPDQCDILRAGPDGKNHKVFRVRTTGFSCISDWDGRGDWESLLQSQGCVIAYACDAIHPAGGYAGSMAAPLGEIRYTLPDGTVRYAYVLTSAAIDDWQQEVWTSDVRLSASAAADTILAARKLAYHHPSPCSTSP